MLFCRMAAGPKPALTRKAYNSASSAGGTTSQPILSPGASVFEKLLQWISDSQIAVLAADNYAVEAHPAQPGPDCCAALPLHEHCLFKLGLHLGELWHLTPLAQWLRAHERSRFLLTAPPLNLPGAVASPVIISPIYSPLRSTATRSEISSTSWSLWVMMMRDFPSAFMLRIIWKSLSVS